MNKDSLEFSILLFISSFVGFDLSKMHLKMRYFIKNYALLRNFPTPPLSNSTCKMALKVKTQHLKRKMMR